MIKTQYPKLDEVLFRKTLSNGLDVIVLPRSGFSRKIAYFVTDFGSIHTEFTFAGKLWQTPAGIAHFLEHKMFDMPGDRDVSAEFAAWGANTNAFTSYDMTAYYFSCTEHFDNCLRLLLEFVSTPYFTEESVRKELGIIDQEIGMNEDAPDSKLYDNLMAGAYTAHPIRVPILGSRESIRQITPEILHTCHRAFYTPGNMLLCVVGDVDPESVEAIALDVLGSETREVGQKIRNWDEPLASPTENVDARMEVAMPMFSLMFKCDPVDRGEEGIRREIIAEMACEALFGESSQLYQQLYEDGIIDTSFGGGFEVIDGCAMLMLSGDSNFPETIREAVLTQAETIAREGVSDTDFARMLRCALGSRIKGLDSFDSTCFRLCAYHLSDFDYFDFPRIYESIRPEELQAFLAETIRRENSCLSVIYPTCQEEQP